jgi:uncharacterized membrane protein
MVRNRPFAPATIAAMKPLTKAGVVLGLGLGGFVDGIVLHQILGWHHLICTTETCQVETVEALKRQNMQDGFFHFVTWLMTTLGVGMLFRAARAGGQSWTGKTLTGAMLAGWGIFNLVEGLIDHHLLGIHHVLPGHANEFLYDLLFLASGATLTVIGWTMVRTGQHQARSSLTSHPRGNWAAGPR